MKKLFILIVLFYSSIIFAENLDSVELDEGNIILSEEGYGKTPKEAKDSALQELIFKIKSDVNSSFTTSKHSTSSTKDGKTKGSMTKDMTSKITIKGKSFFVGLHYSDIKKEKDGSYYTKVVVTSLSLDKTLSTLYKDVLISPDILNEKEKRMNLVKIDTFYSLYPYAKNDKALMQKISIEKVDKQKILLYRSLNMAKIVFKTNVINPTIEIANKKYSINEAIFLPKGNYVYTLSKKGYISEKGKFFAQAGRAKIIEKSLIKENNDNLKIYLKIAGDYNIQDDVASVLSHYKIQTTTNAYSSNSLSYSFHKELIADFGTTAFYRFSLTVKAYKGAELVMVKKAMLKHVARERLNQKAHLLAKALTKALLKKLDMQKFHSRIKGNSSHTFLKV